MKRALIAILLVFLSLPAIAQTTPLFTLSGRADLSAVTTSSRVILPTTGKTIVLWNIGANEAFIALGASTISATTNSYSLPAGTGAAINIGAATHVAAITAAGSTTIRINQGTGTPVIAGGSGGGGGGGGGAVTIADGADVTLGARADTAATSDTGTFTHMSFLKRQNATLTSILAAATGDVPSVTGAASPGTAATKALLVGGIYNATPPTLTNGQQASAQFNAAGALQVNNINIGAQADAAAAADNSTTSLIALIKRTNQNLTTLITAMGTATPTGGNIMGRVGIDQTTPGTTNRVDMSMGQVGMQAEPCKTAAKTSTPISIVTATTTRIIAPTAAKKTYICSMMLYPAGTTNIGIVEGTGGTCGTGTAGVIGGTTAAAGIVATAQAGFALGNGEAFVAATAGTNVDFCLITSAAIQVSGVVTWAAQ